MKMKIKKGLNKLKILLLYFIKIIRKKKYNNFFDFNGDWGLGIGDWGLGIGDWAQCPVLNPPAPIPKSPKKIKKK